MSLIRTASREDAPAIRRLARATWHAAYGEFIDPERIDEIIEQWYDLERLEGQIIDAAARADTVFLLAGGDDEAADEAESGPESLDGFAYAGPWHRDETVAYLYRIYVRPDSWGEGIGSALLERLVDTLEVRFDRLRLTVLADNDVGVSFYESRGFERVDTRGSGLHDGQGDELEEYVYEKPL